MGKKNVYLSLDDLHKLYGISNTVINAIKKKRKKRRNKKLKINNGSMGNKPSPSDHMVGSSSALTIATQQLNNASINKRIEDINRNNLMLENKKEDTPLEVKIYNKLKNKEILTPDELTRYEEIQNVMLPKLPETKTKRQYIKGRKTFPVSEISKPSALSSLSQSNIMGREEGYTNIKISEDDSAGSNAKGTSSDNFINNEVEEFVAPSEPANVSLPVTQNNDELPSNNDSVKVEPDVTASNEQDASEYKSVDSFTIKELKQMAKQENVTLVKNINKSDLYNILLDLELIPLK